MCLIPQTGTSSACQDLARVLNGRKLSLVGDSVFTQFRLMIQTRCSQPEKQRMIEMTSGLPRVLYNAPALPGIPPSSYDDSNEGTTAAWAAWERDMLSFYSSETSHDVVSQRSVWQLKQCEHLSPDIRPRSAAVPAHIQIPQTYCKKVSVVNFGVHYHKPNDYRAILRRYLHAVSRARANGAREVMWAETTAQHFMTGNGGFFTESKQLPSSVTEVTFFFLPLSLSFSRSLPAHPLHLPLTL